MPKKPLVKPKPTGNVMSDSKPSVKTLVISGFPSNTVEWDVMVFLDSKKYSGGGDILEITYDAGNRRAQVKFVNEAGKKT